MKKILKKIYHKIRYPKGKQAEINENLFKSIKHLEYKLAEERRNTNLLLYEMYLANAKKKKKFNPKVSIIVPLYNGSNYLKYAIDSALNQTYKNIEIIVVNDGSDDEGKGREIAKSYGKKIRYYEKENGGVSSALNYGIKKMKGEYFAWLSHDDLIDPEHIEKLVEYVSIEGNEKSIPYASFKIIDERGNLNVEQTIIAQVYCFDYKTSVINNDYTLLKGEINGGSVLIPKEAFEKYGLFDEDQRITQERDMWSRLIKEYKFINIPYVTASIRKHSQQVTNTNPLVLSETYKKNLEIIKDMSDERIEKLGLNKVSFYEDMKYHYYFNGVYTLVKEMQSLIDEELQKK